MSLVVYTCQKSYNFMNAKNVSWPRLILPTLYIVKNTLKRPAHRCKLEWPWTTFSYIMNGNLPTSNNFRALPLPYLRASGSHADENDLQIRTLLTIRDGQAFDDVSNQYIWPLRRASNTNNLILTIFTDMMFLTRWNKNKEIHIPQAAAPGLTL